MMVARHYTCVAVLTAFAGCAGAALEGDGEVVSLAENLAVREIDDGLWLHTSWRMFGDVRVPSHGLLVRNGDHLVMIDTAWGDGPTRRLLEWIDAGIRLPVRVVIVTHGHDDRMGGAAAVVEAGGEVFMGAFTLGGENTPLRSHNSQLMRKSLVLSAPDRFVEVENTLVYYPGPAHTADNLMVWIEEYQLLFAGCAVRPLASDSLGNVADADIDAWDDTMERALARFGHAKIVIPAHGDAGNAGLLRHTAELARRAALEQRDEP